MIVYNVEYITTYTTIPPDLRWRGNLKKLRKVLISIRVPLRGIRQKIDGKAKLKYEERLKRILMMTRKKLELA